MTREGCQNAASTPASQSTSMKEPHVSLDLLVEILSKLRVKQLITLRCVCKAWNDLISGDSNLAKKHLLVSTCNQDCHHIITSSQHMPPEFLLSGSPFTSIFGPTSHPTQFRLPNCVGILCNPSIRKLKILPPLNSSVISYTLGYDCNNYKVIALTKGIGRVHVHVHAFGTDSWRMIEDFPDPNFISYAPGTILNNYVNWLASGFIVSLDLKSESYQKISLPADIRIPNSTIGTFSGCLSLVTDRFGLGFLTVWIMKEFGNGDSWSIRVDVPPGVIMAIGYYVIQKMPCCCSGARGRNLS
ncbi:F-box/kelch-repeat protein At3g23880 [Lathyrus oleraceus]|uniref:F-box domain-containing protein n=1 Tax=Pisum sativum TaxID=3888 RepID=A0A9D4W9B5_PEA|nr:F-box/kelch-repeat protein At3g23880-like [Pisum sativum]KAI5397219.1 hypothetical protein KIW84_063151 [Pisum sativum]